MADKPKHVQAPWCLIDKCVNAVPYVLQITCGQDSVACCLTCILEYTIQALPILCEHWLRYLEQPFVSTALPKIHDSKHPKVQKSIDICATFVCPACFLDVHIALPLSAAIATDSQFQN